MRVNKSQSIAHIGGTLLYEKIRKEIVVLIIENLQALKIHKLTQAQYDRELAAGNIDQNALYLVPDKDIDLSGYATIEQIQDLEEKIDEGFVAVTNEQIDTLFI